MPWYAHDKFDSTRLHFFTGICCVFIVGPFVETKYLKLYLHRQSLSVTFRSPELLQPICVWGKKLTLACEFMGVVRGLQGVPL